MPIGAAIGGAASLGSAAIGASAAKKAASVQADAANRALSTQERMFETSRNDLAPYRNIGENALYTLAGFYGMPTPASTDGSMPASPGGQQAINNSLQMFTQTPDYQFAFQQGMRALDASAASRGLLQSGSQIRGAQEFGQGLASQQYGNYFNRLLALSQQGQNAATSGANNALAAGQQQANTITQLGQANASGIVGQANALSGGLNSLGTYGLISRMQSSYGTPSVAPQGISFPSSVGSSAIGMF